MHMYIYLGNVITLNLQKLCSHEMSLPVKVRQRQLHVMINAFILVGMFILICPILTVMASYTFMWQSKAPLSATQAL